MEQGQIRVALVCDECGQAQDHTVHAWDNCNFTPVVRIVTNERILSTIYDALRFARDEFLDENGLPWSNDEYSEVQQIIDAIDASRIEV